MEQSEDWDPTLDYSNVIVTLDDDREFTLNVWTYDFLQIARQTEVSDGERGNFTIPPDLFVKELTRECLESVVAELLLTDGFSHLAGAGFGISFQKPWVEVWELNDLGDSLEVELKREIGTWHPLDGKEFSILAVREDRDEVLVDFGQGEIAMVLLTGSGKMEENPRPFTRLFHDLKTFWEEYYFPEKERNQ
ncbi:MAG: hypothetical protein H6581_00675 [Bacteroidia bacterium]|nr:hypothetical protein [Bacteroidia bacterium]